MDAVEGIGEVDLESEERGILLEGHSGCMDDNFGASSSASTELPEVFKGFRVLVHKVRANKFRGQASKNLPHRNWSNAPVIPLAEWV